LKSTNLFYSLNKKPFSIEFYDEVRSLRKTRRFSCVGIGGTFSQLHKGHKAIINKALDVGDMVLIGLTTDEMVKKLKKRHPVTSYEERRSNLEQFLRENDAYERVQILPLEDPYGPAARREDQEAIVVSTETAPRVEEINKLRQKNGFKALEVVVVDMVLAEDGKPIYSTRIHLGEIDPEGRVKDS